MVLWLGHKSLYVQVRGCFSERVGHKTLRLFSPVAVFAKKNL